MAGLPRALLLDLGNVVAFFDHGRACRALAALRRPELTEAAVRERIFTSGLEREFDCGRLTPAAFVAHVKEACGLETDDAIVAAAWVDIFEPNPRVSLVLPRIAAAGVRLVLASNTNALHFEWLRTHQPGALAQFDERVLSYQVGAVKPSPRFFDACLAAAAADPSACLFVDDKPEYVEAAAAYGIPAAIYTPDVDLAALVGVRS